eukprot:41819_1
MKGKVFYKLATMRSCHILFIVIHWIVTARAGELCDASYQCAGVIYNANTSTSVSMRGYKSGVSATFSSTGSNIACRAARSCIQATFTESIQTQTVTCDGESSCTNSTFTGSSITIYGVNGAIFTSFTNNPNHNQSTVICNGLQSCAYSSIHNMSYIQANGAYSLYKAIIDTQNSDNVAPFTLELSGAYTAFGARMICATGTTCIINCNAYTACSNFYIDCAGECVINANHTIAPITNINEFDSVALIPSVWNSLSFTENNDVLCSASTHTVDDGADSQFRNGNITVFDSDPICCRARVACRYSLLQYKDVTGQDVICNGFLACQGSYIAGNNGNVFCTARSSCKFARISNTNILYCGSMDACESTHIVRTRTVLCAGTGACDNARISSDGVDINVNFSSSFQPQAHVHCNAGDVCNINCGGFNACDDVMVLCDGMCHFQCDSSSGCPVIYTVSPTAPTTIPPTQYPTSNAPTKTPSKAPTYEPGDYILVELLKTGDDAFTYCVDTYGTSLATIHSAGDNLKATNACKPYCVPGTCGNWLISCIIGLNDKENERDVLRDQWIWADGSNYDFQNWRNDANEFDNEPNNNGNEDCVVIFPSDHPEANDVGTWADVNCNVTEFYFLCNSPPTAYPTSVPSKRPSINPSEAPSKVPSNSPTTSYPTVVPSKRPSMNPLMPSSNHPSIDPTQHPTNAPSNFPTISPTMKPTQHPTNGPSNIPTHDPTMKPTNDPTKDPTNTPTDIPSNNPTNHQTNAPTHKAIIAINNPSNAVTNSPTEVSRTNDPIYETTDGVNENDGVKEPRAELTTVVIALAVLIAVLIVFIVPFSFKIIYPMMKKHKVADDDQQNMNKAVNVRGTNELATYNQGDETQDQLQNDKVDEAMDEVEGEEDSILAGLETAGGAQRNIAMVGQDHTDEDILAGNHTNVDDGEDDDDDILVGVDTLDGDYVIKGEEEDEGDTVDVTGGNTLKYDEHI